MEHELYCFERYKGFTIIVEPLDYDEDEDTLYEGIAIIGTNPDHPLVIVKGYTGEEACHKVVTWIDNLDED